MSIQMQMQLRMMKMMEKMGTPSPAMTPVSASKPVATVVTSQPAPLASPFPPTKQVPVPASVQSTLAASSSLDQQTMPPARPAQDVDSTGIQPGRQTAMRDRSRSPLQSEQRGQDLHRYADCLERGYLRYRRDHYNSLSRSPGPWKKSSPDRFDRSSCASSGGRGRLSSGSSGKSQSPRLDRFCRTRDIRSPARERISKDIRSPVRSRTTRSPVRGRSDHGSKRSSSPRRSRRSTSPVRSKRRSRTPTRGSKHSSSPKRSKDDSRHSRSCSRRDLKGEGLGLCLRTEPGGDRLSLSGLIHWRSEQMTKL